MSRVAKFFQDLFRRWFGEPEDDESEWFEDYPAGADRIPPDVWKKRIGKTKDIKEEP